MSRQDRYQNVEDGDPQRTRRRPLREPGLAPGSYQNDPGHHGSHGGYWEREDTKQRHDNRGSFQRADDKAQPWPADERAEHRHEHDHHGKGPRNYRRSDDRISEDVYESLTDDHMLDASQIIISVSDREVTLDGTVASRTDKRRADDCADAVNGVEHVQNNLRVNRRSETFDRSITIF